MANIILNNYCNQSCPYCFAKNIMAEDFFNLDLISFERIVIKLKELQHYDLGLIGGEPTLNPNFKEILLFLNSLKDFKITLFTNGTYLEQFIPYLNESYKILININSDEYVSKENLEKTKKSLEALKDKKEIQVDLGITLFPDIKDIDYIIQLANIYHKKILRVSFAAPILDKKINYNKDDYYMKGKEIFIQFIEKCKLNKIYIALDCNRIPLCYFSEKDLLLLDEVLIDRNDIKFICQPSFDIFPNGDVIPCFGCGKSENIQNIFNFNSSTSLFYNIYFKEMAPLLFFYNSNEKCQQCNLYQSTCQGGCLAFNKI